MPNGMATSRWNIYILKCENSFEWETFLFFYTFFFVLSCIPTVNETMKALLYILELLYQLTALTIHSIFPHSFIHQCNGKNIRYFLSTRSTYIRVNHFFAPFYQIFFHYVECNNALFSFLFHINANFFFCFIR